MARSPRLTMRALGAQILDLLVSARDTLRAGGPSLAAIFIGSQVLVAVVVSPLVRWMFDEALRTAGVIGLDMRGATALLASPAAVGLIIGVVVLAFVVMLTQLGVLASAVRRVRHGEALSPREILGDLRGGFRALVRPGALALALYLFVIVPLAGFGFVSVVSQAIAVPKFVTGELTKTVPGVIALVVFFVIMGELFVRFSLTVPLLVSARGVDRVVRRSWKLTRRHSLSLTICLALVALAAVAVGLLLVLVAPAPVAVTDAVWPDASLPVAAVMLAVCELIGIAVMGTAVVVIVAMLIRTMEVTGALPEPAPLTPASRPARSRAVALGAVALVACVTLGAGAVPALSALERHPDTLVLAHRGFTAADPENTIESLDAALAAGVDLVEMDVMETADEQFIVMHDANLKRLTGQNVDVADLTFAEATALTVRDGAGNTGRIPSLEEYVTRAAEIGQRLLIEVKLHGGESDDLVPRLLAELDALGLTDANIYHSLDGGVVDDLKRLRPGLTVGYTMALAGTSVPRTDADFLVVEEASYTTELTRQAREAGLGMFVWTVNTDTGIRQALRDGVEGIISDHGDVALTSRDEMDDETGMSGVLYDAIFRFVKIF